MPESIDTRHGVILYLEDVSVSFSGYKALNNLSLAVDRGELRCLIGPNGAGKTTLMDVITGKTKPDAGSAFLGQDINLLNHDEATIARLGVGRKFQKPSVFPQHTVRNNLALAVRGHRGPWEALRYRATTADTDRVSSLLESIALVPVADRLAGGLSHGQKQWLEIGMLLAQEPSLLLIDEPVAGMTQQETERTAELLQSLVPERSVVVVEHDMVFVRSIARKVTVLHEGSVLMEGSIGQVQSDARVREVYLGEAC
ncbi:MAG: urea ABC transporter ATP-binding protein UrtD [Congregibacter sp.]|nr:urea ABC transporter ATP-binding protein UrtD [Congregibacter sp.]MDP5070284.1 urea ABC transporter ATP-binding protein UrtD [Congregibacter sp.]